ncbi:MAG: hypothetical protein B6D59_01490 [Campylobacteraceae bacterium 4484_4]|nr:MAG: hypothetical protein B6D59_01490 [Campylobacteraceae bacterium 4484_4]
MKIDRLLPILLLLGALLHADLFYYSHGKKIPLLPQSETKLRTLAKSDIISFLTPSGATVQLTDRIIVGFKDLTEARAVQERYNLTFVKKLTDTMILYHISEEGDALEISNLIAEYEDVTFAHPDFHLHKKRRTITDPLYSGAWHLHSIGINVDKAWEYATGEGVKVAVYDEGIDIDHEDLRGSVYAYANYNVADSSQIHSTYPTTDANNWHGTACAGIITAQANGKGSVGIAPDAHLYAIRYSDEVSGDIEAYTWMMHEGVSIVSNSWGTYTNLDAYTEIFRKLATEGRDGKGILLLFASGNEGRSMDDAGIDDESESPWVISIGASTKKDQIASFSNYGSSLDFVAPGESIITTDKTGSGGYSSGNYTQNFSGTSAAAPVAAGVVTLMLSANPYLTRNEVIDILKHTANKIGQYGYDYKEWNSHAGYGEIDAQKAVEAAKTYHSKLKNFARTLYIHQGY